MQYRQNNPINYSTTKCVLCKMPLKIEPPNSKMPDPEMTYGDFIIRYEHKFLRNIYSIDQIKMSDDLKNIESYYIVFNKFIATCTELNSVLSQYTKTDMHHILSDLEECMEEIFSDDEPEEIKNTIMQTEIKNALSTSYGKVPKFNLKIYAFVYSKLVDFPPHNQYDSFTAKNFFINFHRYSNLSGEIRFIDTIKYYQRSLAELSSSITDCEKEQAKKQVNYFLNKHHYF